MILQGNLIVCNMYVVNLKYKKKIFVLVNVIKNVPAIPSIDSRSIFRFVLYVFLILLKGSNIFKGFKK